MPTRCRATPPHAPPDASTTRTLEVEEADETDDVESDVALMGGCVNEYVKVHEADGLVASHPGLGTADGERSTTYDQPSQPPGPGGAASARSELGSWHSRRRDSAPATLGSMGMAGTSGASRVPTRRASSSAIWQLELDASCAGDLAISRRRSARLKRCARPCARMEWPWSDGWMRS